LTLIASNIDNNQTLSLLKSELELILGQQISESHVEFNELSIEVDSSNLLNVCKLLRDDKSLKFDTLIDLCGIDYLDYSISQNRPRFAVVIHLLSTSKNHRIRLKVFCSDETLPAVPSLTKTWQAAEWYEREAFDLYGIVFDGNEDLRRLLTDYGFVGHPFRKDFPISGNVEMRYDPNQKRVIYQPVTIQKRENVPRIVREEDYGKTFDHG
jgi:NADH-quinone oxidoreductase subunit C